MTHTPAEIFSATMPCPECEGTGGYSVPFNFAGEPYGSRTEYDCEVCDGRGTVQAQCACCGAYVPTFEGNCADCLGLTEVTVKHLGDDRWGVAA